MNWLVATLRSSIGKKLLMALTGLSFVGFLAVHLAGNLTIYGGSQAFNAYAEKLHSVGALLTVFEFGLLAFALAHVLIGLTLFIQNLKARPVRYHIDKPEGGRTLSSKTMPYTGILILAFVVFHLLNFSFVDKADRSIFTIVSTAFQSPAYVVVYILAMILVALHVRHGFWSAFQTLGANHPKYMPAITTISVLLGIAFGIGFGLLPLYITFAR
jgi:succinate dehydrogenase / fumarate reductase cytochrome b subunit